MNQERICTCSRCRGREKGEEGGGREEERKNTIARSLAEENAMPDTWLAQWAATSVLDEDPQCVLLCVHVCVHVRVEGNTQALCFRKPARGSSLSESETLPSVVASYRGLDLQPTYSCKVCCSPRMGCGKQAREKPQGPPDPFEFFSCQVLITDLK